MSMQDPIAEILNAMDRNPEMAEAFRVRILGDDFTAAAETAENEQQAIADLLGKSAELSGAMVRIITAVHARQSNSDEAIAGLRQEQEAIQSTIADMQADIASMAINQSRMLEAIAQLQSDVEMLKADVATLKADVATLKADMVYVKARLDKIDERLDKIDGRLDNTAGANYEFKVQKNLGSIAGQHLRLRRIRTLKGPRADDDQDLRNRVDDAEDGGIITESENHDMWLLDLIFSGRRRDDGKEVLVAAEISITTGDDDISRAKDRAEVLRRAANTETISVVIAEHIDQERYEAAEQAGVVIIPVPEN